MGGRRLPGLVDALGRCRCGAPRLRTDAAAPDGSRLFVQPVCGARRQQLRAERWRQCRRRRFAIPAGAHQLRLQRTDRRTRLRHAGLHGTAQHHRPTQQRPAAGDSGGASAHPLRRGHRTPGRIAVGQPGRPAGAYRPACRQPNPAQAEPGPGGLPAPHCRRHATGPGPGARLRSSPPGWPRDRPCLAHAACAPQQCNATRPAERRREGTPARHAGRQFRPYQFRPGTGRCQRPARPGATGWQRAARLAGVRLSAG